MKMNLKLRSVLIACMLLASLLLVTACSAEATPYENNDAENFTVSVRYDANGGTFTTNTSVIVDSYNISGMAVNADGQVEIPLLAPDNSLRGNDAFAPVNSGYFLAGWYAERSGSEGNYTYSKPWNFDSDVLTVDPNGTYTSAESVLTLYAAWVPMFEVEFYDLASGEYLDSYTYNPVTDGELLLPQWDEETGAIEMYKFPERSGYTYSAAYYDEAGTQQVTGDTLTHHGSVDYATGTANDAAMKLYVEWTEGEWYHIYNVEQFVDNASVRGNYVIHADLDFADEIWPTSLMYGNFAGSIQGNGHTFSNINIEQTNNSKVYAGLFGQLTETASVTDLKLDNLTFTIEAGTRVAGAAYGLFAGAISSSAQVSNVEILSGTLQISSEAYFGVDDYVIGVVCGMGDATLVDGTNIICTSVGDNAANVAVTVDGNEVSVEWLTD